MGIPRNILEMLYPDNFREAEAGTREILREVYAAEGIDGVIEEAVNVAGDYTALIIENMALTEALRQVKEAGSWEGAKAQAVENLTGGVKAPSLAVVPDLPSDSSVDAPGFYL